MAMTTAEKEKVFGQLLCNHFARNIALARLELHSLVDSESDPEGIRCDTDFCRAFHDHRVSCGDFRGDYTGLVHFNRARRAEARDAGKPYEHGRLYYDADYEDDQRLNGK